MSKSAGFALVTGAIFLRSKACSSSRLIWARPGRVLIHKVFHFSRKPTGKLCFLFHKLPDRVVIGAEWPAIFSGLSLDRLFPDIHGM